MATALVRTTPSTLGPSQLTSLLEFEGNWRLGQAQGHPAAQSLQTPCSPRSQRHRHFRAPSRRQCTDPRPSGSCLYHLASTGQRQHCEALLRGPVSFIVTRVDSRASMTSRLLGSPVRRVASPASASRTACARAPACTLSSGHAPVRQAARSSQPQAGTAAAHAQRMQPPGVSSECFCYIPDCPRDKGVAEGRPLESRRPQPATG